jgi:pyridoxamine 5'-phosphate oxidase
MDPDRVAALRAHYAGTGLDEADLAADPIVQFERWLTEVVELGVPEPNAMVLSTADAEGRPSSRHVLLKGIGADGFVFYTNYGSRKGREAQENPKASLVLPFVDLERQVVVVGAVERATREEAEAYFATRPRGAQLSAWASAQSSVVAGRGALESRMVEAEAEYDGREVPCPPHWGGIRVAPAVIEFWQGRADRLHDRLVYRRDDTGATWSVVRLSP